MARNKECGLTAAEIGDIKLWFGWGAVLGYPTDPHSYLREALQPKFKAEFLAMPRVKRKEILLFIIDEHKRRTNSSPPYCHAG